MPRLQASTHVAVRLSAVLTEVADGVAAFRVGPDRLPVGAVRRAVDALAWVAYWYRDHAQCADQGCACWANLDGPSYPRAFGGEGVLLAAYADGRVGAYALDHRLGDAPLDWPRIAEEHPRMTGAELTAIRGAARAQPARFARIDGGVREPDPAAAAVWKAWDTGIARFGLWCEPANGLQRRAGGPWPPI